MDFSAYRTAVRKRADELAVIFLSGYYTVVSDDNAIKGSVAGIKTQCNLINAAKPLATAGRSRCRTGSSPRSAERR